MGGKPRPPPPPGRPIVLQARPAGAGPGSWPTQLWPEGRVRLYDWATVHPDGSGGWSVGLHVSDAFPEDKLEDLVEAWLAASLPWLWEFRVIEVD